MYEIIINKIENEKHILLLENGNLVEMYKQKEENIENNIYLGKVQNVLPGMGAAFVNIGENKNTFIHFKDLLPKSNEKDKEKNEKNQNIKDYIRPGDPILVQVKRVECNKKGARVSKHVSLSGKYIVLMPETDIITISQKIDDENERKRLLEIAKQALPPNFGVIIRTSAYKKEKQVIEDEIKQQLSKWEKIKEESKIQNPIPRLIYRSDSLVKKMLIDLAEKKVSNIIVNTDELVQQTNEMLQDLNDTSIKVILEKDNTTISKYDIQNQIDDISNRKIWLKCGGFITIDKTEALTAIDVNSGKYIGTKNLEQTVLTVNKEATIEIAKQLKLRDIGGIIIIDYIDMQDEKNKEKILKILKEELKKDRSKTQIAGFSKLNLLEMTRKHIAG